MVERAVAGAQPQTEFTTTLGGLVALSAARRLTVRWKKMVRTLRYNFSSS